MVSVKELRSIELSSYTIIATAIAVLFSIISSIIMTIAIGITSPNALGVSIYLISTLVVGTLMYTTYNTFCQGFLYNTLGKKLNIIQIAFKDEKEIIKISPATTAIIVSMILTIQMILLYLASVFIFPLLINAVIQTLMLSGQQILAYGLYQFMLVLSQPIVIAMIIFGTFIISFVFILLGCYIYNILANSGRGIIVNLSKENGYTAIDSVNVKRFSIVFGIIGGILSLLSLVISMGGSGNITALIINIIIGFIVAFASGALTAIFYNFLAPKLGKLKLELIDLTN
ncbi:hypothetical protein [uncultured Methanobrevibacter sp.]|uniref:hypothetical protein n=1 Tax=uncultured Methanobrevibacter sp. TaxID=253161 RepID=UPI0025E7FF87|nr:hypothetical protein [uncultured Methanobrevibacter sp.]